MSSSATKASSIGFGMLPRPLLISLAVVFCLAVAIYAGAWITDARRGPHPVELGFNIDLPTYFDPVSSSIEVYNVAPGSPAERAGLRAGDQIIGLNGQTLTSYRLFDRVWNRSRPGDSVDVTVRRNGAQMTLHATFRATATGTIADSPARSSARSILSLFPTLFIAVGFTVLFLRLDNGDAWLLALLFAAFIAVPSFNDREALPRLLENFTAIYQNVVGALLTPVFYIFFAVFPVKSPLERKVPWLKWVALGLAVAEIVPGLPLAGSQWPGVIRHWLGDAVANQARSSLHYLWLTLGLVSLLWNCYGREVSVDARRKSRVLLLGTLAGVLPIAFERFLVDLYGYRPLFWLDVTVTFLVLLYPLSFAYAVVKHRVLEIPALLQRSARYVLVQRGYFVLLIFGGLLAISLFSHAFSGYFAGNSQYGMVLSAAFGVALVWVSGPFVKRGTESIDRAFFRSAYDARMILQDLAEKSRSVADRRQLAALLEQHLTDAFHPQQLAIYFATAGDVLSIVRGKVPDELSSISLEAPFLNQVRSYGRTWDVPPAEEAVQQTRFPLAPVSPECLVPMLGHGGRLAGLLVLGQPRSEQPYSREDKRLLDSVAGQAAVALENMHLAEQIADRMEIDRRAAHELQIAREVQARLFPQVQPPLTTLEYAGSCMQARHVGGDYYDFLDLGSSQRMDRGATKVLDAAAWHLAFVLADISGKGIAGALLMANLQANLRSRYALALDDLPRLLGSVNELFHENTPEDRYATLFFAVYDDHSRELEYANCGHNAPLLFRANGELERLASTATVIGLFPNWKCETRFVTLKPGDLLVIFTDGVTEANDTSGNEFGEARLIETVRSHVQSTPAQLIQVIQEEVQRFAAGQEQFDDLTLVIARAR
ncbi:MAG TPA: SpoIIE family protein phosphatase [Methylomirabilota bacterium]|nr:SpoIIE family protein phosphatase [Methylomirabilota bacterium]